MPHKVLPRRAFQFLPLRLRIETLGNVANPLVLRGTPLPAKRSEIFSTAQDNQSSVEVSLFMGESPLTRSDLHLGKFQLREIPLAAAGEPLIEVQFSVAADCTVTARATLQGTQLAAEQTITPSGEMTDEFIADMLSNAELNRAADEAELLRVEATNRARGLIKRAEARLASGPDKKLAVAALKAANYKAAQKQLEKAYKVAPSSAEIDFLFGYLFVQLKDNDKAETSLKQAASIDPHKVQALTLLGRVQLQRQHVTDAIKTLEQAVEADAGYWMAHNLLGDAYLKEKDYEKARQQAQLAIDEGKQAGSVAELVLGQALANVGRDKEGIEALNKFVVSNPENPAVPQVKALIVKIEDRDAGRSGIEPGTDLALAASEPSLPESSWGPPGVDDVKPPVAPGVVCPYQQVLEATGLRVKELVDNITKFAAVEDLVHEQLDKTGNPVTKETRKFNYVASITEEQPGYLSTSEYRDLRYGITDLPDHIVTTGFVTLALIFHPDMRDNFQMTCEGLGDWHGQPAWLMYFRARDDKPNRFADYVVGTARYPMKLKGRAWIATSNLQIVRIESDLVKPLPQMAVQHQIVEYGPVRFKSDKSELWLPQSVDIYLELNHHRYHRRHSFDHYMLFAVNSQEKTQTVKNGPGSVPAQNR
jgi:tetratricopeptide (TPR) repeat protein